MIKALIKLANQLDSKGMNKEADYIDRMIFSYAQMKSDEKPEDFFMLDDDFDDEKPEESGPLKVDLGPDAVNRRVELVYAEPSSLESMGFQLNKTKPDPKNNTFRINHDDMLSAEPLAKMVAEKTGHVYVTGPRGRFYDDFSRLNLINGKPGMMLQNLIGLKHPFQEDIRYLVVLKTYNDKGDVLFYSKEYPSLEAIMEDTGAHSEEQGMLPVEEIDDRFPDLDKVVK